jgi:POT family proton-dependent oligopeptide transporter
LSATETTAESGREFLGHPRGLVILFFAEMWERFSYYGMRALLVLYLTQHWLMADAEAQGLYAAYAALVYLMPVAGGLIADRLLGARKAVTIGALLLVVGHFTMAFEGQGGRQTIEVAGRAYTIEATGRDQDRVLYAVSPDQVRTRIEITAEGLRADLPAGVRLDEALPAFTPTDAYTVATTPDAAGQSVLFLALALIIVGVGFLKPNISTVVGSLYAEGDPRRDGGFTIFYVGINLGAFISSLACAWLGITYGWRYGFGLAGIGMLAGLAVFLWGQRWLEGKAEPPEEARLKRRVAGVPVEAWIYILGILTVIPAWLLVQRHAAVEVMLAWLAPGIFLAMFAYAGLLLRGAARSRMLVALILIAFSVLFWTLFEQAGSSLTLFAERSTSLPNGFNAGMTQSFNPLIIMILGPVMAWLWVGLHRRGWEPSTPTKFSLALMLVGAGFLLLVVAARTQAGADFRVPVIWLFLAYLLHTIGELCLSPVGLSMITKLSLPRVVGLMMGVWFLSSALAHMLAGQIATMTAAKTVGGVVVDPAAQLATYASVFGQIGWAGVIAGVLLLVCSPKLKDMMAGVR